MVLNRAKCEGRCAKKQWSGDHVCWLWRFASKFELRLHELQFFWQNFTNSISAFALKHDFEGFCKVFHIASQILNSRALNVYLQHLFCVVLYQLILTSNQNRVNLVFEAFELTTFSKCNRQTYICTGWASIPSVHITFFISNFLEFQTQNSSVIWSEVF